MEVVTETSGSSVRWQATEEANNVGSDKGSGEGLRPGSNATVGPLQSIGEGTRRAAAERGGIGKKDHN